MLKTIIRVTAFMALIACPVTAQQTRIQSPAEFLGYPLGERFTDHAGVVRYMEALAAASPIVRVRRYGETNEGRPLMQVLIARADYLERSEQILARNRELANPATSEVRAREIAATTPAVVYFSYGVHGNESSSSEAALWTAWSLATNAAEVRSVLDSVVMVIDPTVNPDGRDRYVNWYRQARGIAPNPNPESREHVEPWPGGRTNHYLFDLNRDWAWATQKETRARLATWDYWTPQVHVDFHEMSANSSYFFFPAAAPINPMYPPHILRWGKHFGDANAAAFDARGWAYFTGETYDLFYPGYGDSWPTLLGAIGMTYEQAGGGSAGLAYRRNDQQILTLHDRAEHHWISGMATARAAASKKTELQLDFARFYRTVGEGVADVLLVPGHDVTRVDALVNLLRRQGIQVERATRAFRTPAQPHTGFARREQFPAGTYRVRARQQRGRLASTLLQPETLLDATFSYDVSAWSLPFAYGVEAHRAERIADAEWRPVTDTVVVTVNPMATNGAQPYGYLVPPSAAVWPPLTRYLTNGGRAIVLDEGFTLESRTWPAGTLFIPRLGVENMAARLSSSGLAAFAQPVATGRALSGHDLGTAQSYALEVPRLALLSGDGVNSGSYGAHWFFLENTAGLQFDHLPLDRVESVRLERYQVMIAPDMARPNERISNAVKAWVQAGGTLVAVGNGARNLGALIAEVKLRESRDTAKSDAKVERALRGREARELENWEQQIPGTILTVKLDPAHPLAFGAGVAGDSTRLFVLHSGGAVFEPDENFETVAYFPDKLEKVSGVISEQNLQKLGRGAWLVTKRLGRGRVILFADDPLFRHFWYSTFQPYLSAILVGPKL
jgi:hypothetical protein